MASVTVDLTQFNGFQAQLRQVLGPSQKLVLQVGGERAGAKIDELVRSVLPPGEQSSKPSPLRTAKQRRWWWATMNAKAAGKSRALPGWKAVYKVVDGRKTLVISGQYKRTGKLVQSLTWIVVATNSSARVSYGSNRVYAPYVLGNPMDPDPSKRQALIHQSTWTPLHHIIYTHLNEINDQFLKGAMTEIERLLGG